jgi:hypothetical protein
MPRRRRRYAPAFTAQPLEPRMLLTGGASVSSQWFPTGDPPDPQAPTVFTAVPRRAGVRIGFVDNSTSEFEFTVERRLAQEPETAFVQVGTVDRTPFGESGGVLYFQDTTSEVGKTYVYRVRAVNPAGASEGSDYTIANSPGFGRGLRAEFFDESLSSREQFETAYQTAHGVTFRDPVPSAETFGGGDVGPAGLEGTGGLGGPVGIDADTGDPVAIDPETFSGRFTGFFWPEFTESYTFLTNSDDGVSLKITDFETEQVVIDFDNLNTLRGMGPGFADVAGTANLVRGRTYWVEALFSENTGQAGHRFGYTSRSTGAEAFPSELVDGFMVIETWGPRVTQVFVNGPGLTGQTSANGVAFRNLLGVDNTFGYAVPGGSNQLRSPPWMGGIDQIALRFDRDMSGQLEQRDLSVLGANVRTYGVSGFRYDAPTRTGVWTLATPILNDKVRLFVDDADVPRLDGEWTNGAGTYPSGNNRFNGDFDFHLNVLRGNATGDDAVNALDLSYIRQRLNKTATNSGAGLVFSPFADITAVGAINALDLSAARQRLNGRLPAGQPAGIVIHWPIPFPSAAPPRLRSTEAEALL